MRNSPPQAVRLCDYMPPDFLIDSVALDISLHKTQTRVRAKLALRRNPKGRPDAPLTLDGDGLTPRRVALDGRELAPQDYETTPESLTLRAIPPAPFALEIETLVDPTANTQLSGLYRSGSAYCTQCEAEGFRRITYFLDRPDVLSVYTTRIEADRSEAPVLLGNGNPIEAGELPDGRHFAVWHDPFPKPSYLFALVGGDLGHIERRFVTASGREVKLAIYVEHGKEPRADYAMDALERAMRWDEATFGREYDLDVFNIVAVSDFNMGAMENKGLNIFNDKYVLASPQTATDGDYAGIEAVIAHEYFHNWTGNRITCRDWFQLCLKEGLTVFRDQEFSSDQRSRAVKRISDVRGLRLAQFPEDAGPLAHPVRPRLYREINNFYTATVYEKGAEIVRMLKTLIGADAFRRGMDIYFQRFDGTAATVEDFLSCFAESSGRDLTHFALWYEQAGTPLVVNVATKYDAAARTFTLSLTQRTPPTPGQDEKQPLLIPIALALFDEAGEKLPLASPDMSAREVSRELVEFSGAERQLRFTGLAARPTLSLLRGFSAPARLEPAQESAELERLLAHDDDPFNRWQAAQSLALRSIFARVAALRAEAAAPDDRSFAAALRSSAGQGRRRSGLHRAGADPAGRDRPRPRGGGERRSRYSLQGARRAAPRAGRGAQTRARAMPCLERRYRAVFAGRRQRGPARAAQRVARFDRGRRRDARNQPRAGAIRDGRQYDRPARGAVDARADRRRRARKSLRAILPGLRRRRAGDRQMVLAASLHPGGGDDEARPRADDASRFFARQSQPRARADRRLRERQPHSLPCSGRFRL